MDRRSLLQYGLGVLGATAVSGTVLSSCGSSSSTSPTTTSKAPQRAGIADSDLLEAARRDGALTTAAVGVADSYYAPVVAGFEELVGFTVDTQHPTYLATSQVFDLAEARDLGEPPPYDVVELTQSTADQAATDDLLTTHVSTRWVDIPPAFKDPNGHWSASYFGLVSFIVNSDVTGGFQPGSWDELATSAATPQGSFAMLGDPRTGSPFEGGLGLLTVMSAAMANGGGADDVEPGLALLAELVEKGIFDLGDSTALLALPDDAGSDATPINALYSFDLPLARHSGSQTGTTVVGTIPSDGVVAGFYPQAIPKGAPNTAAARFWMEYLQSDEAAALFLDNGAIPTRAGAIRDAGPDELRAALPPPSETDALIPSPDQIVAAQEVVDDKWADYLPVEQ